MGTSNCIYCDGTKKVYKEGFYPCPDCNPESNEYRFRGQVRLLCEDIARKEDIIEKLEVENHVLKAFVKKVVEVIRRKDHCYTDIYELCQEAKKLLERM